MTRRASIDGDDARALVSRRRRGLCGDGKAGLHRSGVPAACRKGQKANTSLPSSRWLNGTGHRPVGSFPPQTLEPTPRLFPTLALSAARHGRRLSDEGSAAGGWPLKGQSPLGTESAAGQHLRPHRGIVRRDASAAGRRWQSLCRGAEATSMRARARGPAQLALPAAAAAAHTVASGACARCTAAAAPTSATCTPPQPSCYARSLRHARPALRARCMPRVRAQFTNLRPSSPWGVR